MLIVDIVQSVLDLQCAAAPDDGYGAPLRASAFSAITAAFATQGYWVQADVLDKMLFSHLQLWAPLVYIIAVIGGLIGVAIGSPPRNYMWFFMGPAIYSWLIGAQVNVKGVRWAMPCVGDTDTLRAFQRKVWELSEIGLANTNKARILGPSAAGISKNAEPRAWVAVSHAFLWFDELISSTMINMMRWTGLYNLEPGGGGRDTNLPELPGAQINGIPIGVMWSLYADVKWQALEEITSAGIDSPDFRDAFANFFVVCGDPLRKTFRVEAMMAAAASKGRRIPLSVINCGPGDSCGMLSRSYASQMTILKEHYVPTPTSLKNTVRTALAGAGQWPDSALENLEKSTAIDCNHYLFLLMQTLRVEAAFKYHGLWDSMVPEIIPVGDIIPDDSDRENMLISTLFYGWDIRRDRTWSSAVTVNSEGSLLSVDERKEFAQNLILLHLFRNEYMLTKEIAPIRQTNAEKNQSNVELALKTTSAPSKFSELYTWSLMLPYVQGSLLYFLAMAYPFACVLVVVPGWHKSVFTWMSFWAWAKMWDLGFAMVKALERSIWAMTSQGGNVKYLSDRIVSITENVGSTQYQCTAAGADDFCAIPKITLNVPGGVIDFNAPMDFMETSDIRAAWHLFDQGLLMTKSLNLDLANSYYIFIMAGLYMAIPAVTGQLVLGARAGASSMVNSMIGGTASDASRAASAGVQGDMSMKLRSNAATISQGSEAKAMASEGLANQALGYSVKGLEEGRAASEAQAMSGALGKIMGQNQNAMAMREAAAKWDMALGQGITGAAAPGATAGVKRAIDGKPVPGAGGGGGDGPTAGGIASKSVGALSDGALGLMMAESNYQGAADFYGAHNAMSAQQAGLDIRAFQGNANSAQLRTAEGNMGRYADFSAKQSAWHDRNGFAMQVSGWSAALGIQTGNVDPGPKPTDMMGMAMSGMLRTSDGKNSAGDHAWHLDWNRGGHAAGTAGIVGSMGDPSKNIPPSGLTGFYGPSAVQSAYHQWTRTEAATGTVMADVFSARAQQSVTAPGPLMSSRSDANPASGSMAPVGQQQK